MTRTIIRYVSAVRGAQALFAWLFVTIVVAACMVVAHNQAAQATSEAHQRWGQATTATVRGNANGSTSDLITYASTTGKPVTVTRILSPQAVSADGHATMWQDADGNILIAGEANSGIGAQYHQWVTNPWPLPIASYGLWLGIALAFGAVAFLLGQCTGALLEH